MLGEPAALVDAAARHHCYELHIGFTPATARRLAEVLERGPLPSTGD